MDVGDSHSIIPTLLPDLHTCATGQTPKSSRCALGGGSSGPSLAQPLTSKPLLLPMQLGDRRARHGDAEPPLGAERRHAGTFRAFHMSALGEVPVRKQGQVDVKAVMRAGYYRSTPWSRSFGSVAAMASVQKHRHGRQNGELRAICAAPHRARTRDGVGDLSDAEIARDRAAAPLPRGAAAAPIRLTWPQSGARARPLIRPAPTQA